MKYRCAVIGNGGFAIRCLTQLQKRSSFELGLVLIDPTSQALQGLLDKFCHSQNLPYTNTSNINSRETITKLAQIAPDFIFNIYGMQILRAELLAIPRLCCVNFHNGPLPRYRGVNVYSWAIINGERKYGITWHEMEETIDTGRILAQEHFGVGSTDTPTTLAKKGFQAGVTAFERLVSDIENDRLKPTEQDDTHATYYSKKDVPNKGQVDFNWSFDRLDCFFRGLDFRPLPNTFVRPTVRFRNRQFFPQRIELIDSEKTAPCGTVIDISEKMIVVQAADSRVALTQTLDSSWKNIGIAELADQLNLRRGDKLGTESDNTPAG